MATSPPANGPISLIYANLLPVKPFIYMTEMATGWAI